MIHPERSRFITYLALFSIVAAVYFIFQDISNLLFVRSITSTPEYHMAEQLMPTLPISSFDAIIDIILQFAGIIASIGLFNRLNWGRIAYMTLLSVITVWGIVSSIVSYLSLSQYLAAYGLGSSLSLVIVWNAVALGITIYIVWRLSSQKIREEFDVSKKGEL